MEQVLVEQVLVEQVLVDPSYSGAKFVWKGQVDSSFSWSQVLVKTSFDGAKLCSLWGH